MRCGCTRRIRLSSPYHSPGQRHGVVSVFSITVVLPTHIRWLTQHVRQIEFDHNANKQLFIRLSLFPATITSLHRSDTDRLAKLHDPLAHHPTQGTANNHNHLVCVPHGSIRYHHALFSAHPRRHGFRPLRVEHGLGGFNSGGRGIPRRWNSSDGWGRDHARRSAALVCGALPVYSLLG